MLKRLMLALAASALIIVPQRAVADPITYDFTGTLNQPFDGASTLSGSCTFNATPAPAEVQYAGSTVTEKGSDVSLTVNVGGQLFNFQNDPQDPSRSATLMVHQVPEQNEVDGKPTVELSVIGSTKGLSFGMMFYIPGVVALPANLATLSLPLYTSSVEMNNGPSATRYQWSQGVVTSIEPVPAPEPSALVVFAGLGIAAVAVRSRRLTGGPRPPSTPA